MSGLAPNRGTQTAVATCALLTGNRNKHQIHTGVRVATSASSWFNAAFIV